MKKGWKNFWITCGVVAGIGCVCLISGKVMGATLTVMDNYIPDWIGLGRGEAGVSYDYGDAPMEADTDRTYGDIHALKLDTEGLNVQILKGTGSGITVQTEDIYSALKFQVTEEDGELKVETTARRFPWRINQGNYGNVWIYIPEAFQLDEADLQIGVGELYVEDIEARELKMEVGTGSAIVDWFTADELDLEVGVGTIDASGDTKQQADLECGVGVHALKEDRYDMIVTPALYCAGEDLIRRLDAFVKRGGVLVSSFRSFVSDEQASVYPDAQPHGLTDCFGMTYNQFTEPGRAMIKGEKIQYFMELMKPESAGREAGYEHPYWGEYAGITRNAYGNGAAWYVGCFTEKELLKEVYQKAAKDAKIPLPAYTWPVTIRSGRTKEGADLHYVLHYSQEERDITCPWDLAEDVLTGKSYRRDDRIHLKDWDVLILREK